ncbi:MAG: hypothetical protein J0L81_09050 [Caulobacterales bacterium]|jgi:predicted DNA-binding transcriptional regulator AlpA|nr:hypothetical protein [Caulobacterales bacterium]
MQPDSELVDEREARAILGNISRATLWRHVRSGRLPQPLKITPGRNHWRRSELVAVVEAAAAAREVAA